MENLLCTDCDGKGFNWLNRGHIISHDGKHIIAKTYKEGPKCMTCKGSGRATRPVTCGTIVVGIVLVTAFFAFVSNPIAHWLFSS